MNNNKPYTIEDLETILDKLPTEVYLKDNEGKYIYANKALKNRLNISDSEIIGKTCDDIFTANIDDCILYDMEYNTKSLKENLIFEFLKRIELERELELFIETASDLCAITRRDGSFKKITNKWTEILGWSEEELLNSTLYDITHPDDLEDSYTYQRNGNNITGSLVSRYRCKNGEYKIIEWFWQYMHYYDHVILTGKDRTALNELESYKKKLEESIALDSLKSDFISNVSHEFRTPINIILSATKLIMNNIKSNDNIPDNLYRNINYIKQNSYRLLKLVNNLIDTTKINNGFTSLQIKNCDIIEVIEDVTLSVADYIVSKKRQIVFDTNEEELIISCDPDKIETIILNLLSNAIKFTEQNGMINVNINVNKNEGLVYVYIKDNGLGINDEYKDLIFNRFTQANNILNRPCEGSGIGLSLVKSLVNLHGGEIWLNKEYKEGTEFVFTLPIKIDNSLNISSSTTYSIIENKIEKYNLEFSDIYSI